jgi:hypothetical protein
LRSFGFLGGGGLFGSLRWLGLGLRSDEGELYDLALGLRGVLAQGVGSSKNQQVKKQ